MTRKISSLLILSLLTFAFLAMTATAAKSPVQRRVVDERVIKMTEYAFPDEHNFTRGTADREADLGFALGSFAPTASPGQQMGDTWYDYQHNGSMGRQIEARTTAGEGTVVHMGWMYLPGPVLDSREYNYNGYDVTNEGFGSRTGLQSDDEYAGYVGVASTSDNRGIIGGHNNEPEDNLYDNHFYWDYSSLASYFGANSQTPRALGSISSPGNPDQEAIWPKFRWVEPVAADPILHVIAQESYPDAGDPQAINYYRRVGTDTDPAAYWDIPACFGIDTIHDLSHEVAANDAGRVALVWTANLPCVAGGPSSAGDDCNPPRYNQWDNDVWYMISENYGAVGSFGAKTNLTQYAVNELEEDGYRPYTDLNVLMDADDGELHIVWGASYWPTTAYSEGDAGYYQGRLFHWAENQPYERVVHAFDWFSPHCSPGAWNINANKLSVSQCRGKHYVLFAQMNDVPNGIGNTETNGDCADEGNPGYPRGSANGDLYVSVSADGGLTWDEARNVTNSRTPGCDSATGVGGACDSDHWPSMSRYGVAEGNPADTAQVIMYPGGDNTSGAGNYLDVLYINDPSAGGIVQNEGSWQNSRVLWARLSCVDEVENPLLGFIPTGKDWPDWAKNGRPDTTDITLENLGNAALSFTSINEFGETKADWLGHTIAATPLPAGLGNVRQAEIYINKAGIINSPGNVTLLEGGIEFVTNAPTSPDTFSVWMIVADTVVQPDQDTVSTTCLSLVLNNNLEAGDADQDVISMGYPDIDCDTTADNYLYSGSPVIGYKTGDHAKMNWSAFSNSYADTIGFVQMEAAGFAVEGDFDTYEAIAYALDSGIIIESKTYANNVDGDDCNFVLRKLTIYDNPDKDGDNSHSGLVIGEVYDWDVPADSGSDNGSDFDEDLMAIWQVGAYYEDTTDGPCLPDENDSRYAGMDFLTQYVDAGGVLTVATDSEGRPFHNAYTVDNATYVYGNDNGFNSDTLYELMTTNTGMSVYSSAVPESTYTDLHMGMTYQDDFTLVANTKLVIWTEIFSTEIGSDVNGVKAIVNKSRAAFCENFLPEGYETDPNVCGCCVNRGNVDDVIGGGGPVDVGDLTWLVAYLFTGGPPPPCIEQGNVDGVTGGGGPVDVGDLTYLVAYLFTGGPAPPPC